jgi:hypothetical protein
MLDLATQRKYVPAEQARHEGRCLHADMNRPTPSVDGREMPVSKDNEVLIKVHAVSRNACDSEALRQTAVFRVGDHHRITNLAADWQVIRPRWRGLAAAA